ncbi:MAG: GyrI-like domain-containing protein [Planctomycetaceae bacterium]|nr:GyrI-like domain-containing protein [Planctomycetaceae bacterium]
MQLRRLSPLVPTFALALCACHASTEASSGPGSNLPSTFVADLPVALAPFDDVKVDWKQRIDQPYVFIEERGSYTGIGRVLERVFAAASEQGLTPNGAPFALYYDDPGKVAPERLRMRACLPVGSPVTTRGDLQYGVLESTTVAYAFVGGAYPEVPRAYPALFKFLARLDWVENGPIREIYLVNPADVTDWSQLVTEVQVPATQAR